jgi:anthranilate synthase component I
VITELEFKSLASQGYNRIPLIQEAFADLETPLSLYLKLAGGQAHSFLLESVVGGERFGRYSFIGLPARTLLRCHGLTTEVVTQGEVTEVHQGNPLDFIAAYQKRFQVALRPGLPRFCGGLAGYFGYDAVRYIEPKLAATQKQGGINTPDILLLQCEELAVIDNLSGRLYLIVYADPAKPEAFFNAQKRLAELGDKLRYSVTAPPVKRGPSYAVEREFDKTAYLAAVAKAKDYIVVVHVGAAVVKPQPLHVLLRHGQLPHRGRQPRDFGAPRKHPRRRKNHHPPPGRHPPTRRHARPRPGP